MDIQTLIDIGTEIRERIRSFITENEDYGVVIAQRKKDITRRMDMEAEKALDSALIKRDLSARVISEELGDRTVGRTPQFMLIFDPIDGSTNAVHGIPFFCTSLACTNKTDSATFDDIHMAVICDILGNVYHAVRGGGAFLNTARITGQKRGTRPKPVISIYSYGVPDVPPGLIELEKSIIVRAFGSIALDMCLVAEGALDGVIDTRGLVNGYDIMASSLILKEAGGRLTDPGGHPISEQVQATGISLVGTGDAELHQRIVTMLNQT